MALALAPRGVLLNNQALRLCLREHNRKAWLFSNTPKGARASAIAYSIVETAKENSLNPFAYLEYLFEQLPNLNETTDDPLAALLPWSDDLPEQVRPRR